MYRVELSRTAETIYRWLHRHDRSLFGRMDAALEVIKSDPFQGKPLKGILRGDFSYRVGSYRILYTIIKRRLVVYVLDIGHHREIDR